MKTAKADPTNKPEAASVSRRVCRLPNHDFALQSDVVSYIRKNRISTTEVADCLDKSGLYPLAKPLNSGLFRVGPVHWIYALDESNWTIHEQARTVKAGEVVLVEGFDCGDRAMFGELVAKQLVLYHEAAAIVSNAPMRDANDLIKEKYPVWCNGVTPIGTFNRKPTRDLDPALKAERDAMYYGAIAVCDDSGVVIIPPEKITIDFYHQLIFIEEQEDIWFDCLDRQKWNTYDIVCLKKYKED